MSSSGFALREADASPARAMRAPSMRGIYAEIRQDIVTLRLRPGERLSENELALRFRTSRAPVREALIRLGEEGLIDVRPQRGSFVSRISLAAMERARFVREALELAAVRKAAQSGLPPALAMRARDAIAEQKRAADDPEHFTRADDAFHAALADASGVSQLWSVIEREKAQFDRIRFLSVPNATPAKVLIDQHMAILTAVEYQDPESAERAMRRHMSEVLKIAQTLAEAHPDLIVDDLPPPRDAS
ncbi:GntR family transcriptional regulator [Terrarubrum flagellatum]|uniref:GntR family transcriptional regulator n=1 Tax=Terrirubrum flagellatum TaxID=2895980 RepID=UPI003145508D